MPMKSTVDRKKRSNLPSSNNNAFLVLVDVEQDGTIELEHTWDGSWEIHSDVKVGKKKDYGMKKESSRVYPREIIVALE